MNPSPKTFGINALRRRGWTKASIEHLLGVADFVVPNQQFPGCADTRLYSCGRVEEAERTPGVPEGARSTQSPQAVTVVDTSFEDVWQYRCLILTWHGKHHYFKPNSTRGVAVPGRGGRRAGAGRPPGSGWKPTVSAMREETIERMKSIVGSDRDPLSVVVDMVLNDDLDVQTRLGAASIALPFLYPRLSATTVDARSTVVKIDGNALIEKLNARLERLAEVPVGIIEGVAADAVETVEAA